MQATLFNRLAMFRSVDTALESHKPTWENQPPLIFTNKVAAFKSMLGGLEELVAKQEADLTGLAELKDMEREDVAELSFEIGESLSGYFDDTDRPDLSNDIDYSESSWSKMRDERLLAKSKTLLARLRDALAADAATLANYDLTSTHADDLEREIGEYEPLIGAPQAANQERSTITERLPQEFRAVTRHLAGMDKNVRRFGRTAAGRAFADAYFASRRIIDRRGPSGSQGDSSESGT